MFIPDKAGVDKMLLQIEDTQCIDPRYRFVREKDELKLLGVGGFSYVYEVEDALSPKRKYAAKIIGLGSKATQEQQVYNAAGIQHFSSEMSENVMRVIAFWILKLQLDSSGKLVSCIHFGEENYAEAEGLPIQIILTEKLEAVLLRDKYANVGLLREELKTEEGVIRLAKDIGRALFTVHNQGYLHRDIKLENIFWDEERKLYKLGDFGIARYVGEEGAETVVFTDGYGAPEIERSLSASYNLTADIYSFGIVLFLLLNNLKFPASDGYHVNIVQYSANFILPAAEKSSETMAAIIRKMCSYKAEERYQSVEEILQAIGRIDGSYTEAGFTEYEELSTQTYREGCVTDYEAETESYREEKKESDKENQESGQKKDCDAKKEKGEYGLFREKLKRITEGSENIILFSREEQKKRELLMEKNYLSYSLSRVLMTAFLCFLFFKAVSPNAVYVFHWEFWLFPIALFVLGILQSIKEFHFLFWLITFMLSLFLMQKGGMDIPYFLALFLSALTIPAITMGLSLGMALWALQSYSGSFLWLDFLAKRDLGWIIMVFLYWLVKAYFHFRMNHIAFRPAEIKKSLLSVYITANILNLLATAFVISGSVLLLLGAFRIIGIPEKIKVLHLFRTGICFFGIDFLLAKKFGLLEEGEDDEPLDE